LFRRRPLFVEHAATALLVYIVNSAFITGCQLLGGALALATL
jgi:hypothetical protein